MSFFVACNSKEDKKEKEPLKKVEKIEPIIEEYGFTFNDYKVVKDTIKSGDTFSAILSRYPLKDSLKAHDVIEKIKASFNVRRIKAGKPYLFFLDKNKPNTLQALIYIEDQINYTVVDLEIHLPLVINKNLLQSKEELWLQKLMDHYQKL